MSTYTNFKLLMGNCSTKCELHIGKDTFAISFTMPEIFRFKGLKSEVIQ